MSSNSTPIMDPEELEEMTREDVLLAAAIIFFVAFFGLIFNILGITVVMKNPILKNSFGTLCLSHSIANSGVLFVFFIWSAPATYIQAQHTNGMISKLLGQLNILCWDACVYSHLAISFNRFFSIAIPARASFIFSRHNTLVIIGIVWFIAFCHIFPYFWYDECYITYDPISWTWNFAATRCGHIISTYTDYYTSVAIFIAMSSVDFSTLILLIIHRKHSHFTSNDEAVKRRKVEIRFFMQSCLQGILFFYEIFNFYYVSTLNTNQWYVFFTATFAWEICHCLDGFVVVLFHFRRRIFLGDSTVTCFFGLLINVLVLITIRKSPHFVNSYGTLAKNHTFLNIICLLVYLLWVTPMTYTQSLSTANSTLGKIMGQLHILFWTSLLYSHLFLSLNRFASLIFPTISRLIFSHIVCLSLILSTWLIGLLHIVIRLFWDRTCYPIYDPATWIWSEATCGDTFIIQYLCILISGISLLLNLSTWILISEETIRRHPIESKLLREELWRTLGFLVAATSSNVLSGWLGERWQKYLLTCVVWQGYHLLDGLIVLVFHFHRKLLADQKNQEPHHTPSFIHVDHPGHHSLPHAPITHHPVHFSRVDTS